MNLDTADLLEANSTRCERYPMMRNPTATAEEKYDPLDALLLDPCGGPSGTPRCFDSTGRFYVRPDSKGDCKSCPLKRNCRAAPIDDLIDSEGKLPCFGAGAHKIDSHESCGSELCGLHQQCETARADLLYRGETVRIGLAHDAAARRQKEKRVAAVPTPPSPPIGSAIILATTGIAVGAAHVESHPKLSSSDSIVRAPLSLVKCVRSATFPFDEEAVRHCGKQASLMNDAELKDAVRSLTNGVHPDGSIGHEYLELRERFLAVSLELNQRGRIGPRFRFRKSLARLPSMTEQMYARDIQLSDLDWLSCHGKPSPAPEFEDIFLSTGLNMARAWEFACRETRAFYKAKFLGLAGIEEHCLAVIQSKETQLLWKRLHEGRDSVIRKIKLAMEEPRSRQKHSPEYLYDAFRALRATKGTRARARSLIAFMGHPEPEKTDFDRQTKWLMTIGLSFTSPPVILAS